MVNNCMQTQWQWHAVSGLDVRDMVIMAQTWFETEISDIFEPDPIAYERNLMRAVVEQFYVPGQHLVMAARDCESNRMVAYVWAQRERACWSDDAMCAVRMVHVDLELSARQRVRVIHEMIDHWEQWSRIHRIPVICSTTMRRDQTAFLRIHQARGYDCRGSFCYRRLDLSAQS